MSQATVADSKEASVRFMSTAGRLKYGACQDHAPTAASLRDRGNRFHGLLAGGRFVVNEALSDGNLDYAASREVRYTFYDTFGRALFKPPAVYEKLLMEAGFEIDRVSPMLDDAFFSVIEAVPT